MPDTSRITSGFDVELQLGGGWFRTALQGLANTGQLLPDPPPPPIPPGATVIIDSVDIVFAPAGRDLAIALTIADFPLTMSATLALSDDGSALAVTTSIPDVEFIVPFDVLDNLAGPPVLQKVPAAGAHAAAIAVLANLDLRSTTQSAPPLPAGEHEERGDAALAQSFLPDGQDIAIGIGAATFPRFANDAWHTQLQAPDGSHPFPDQDNTHGTWESVTILPQSGRIRARLRATVPVDSPVIDLIPDPTITVTIDMAPSVNGGAIVFAMSIDADVETGVLGTLLAGVIGGLIGMLIGMATGAPLFGLGVGIVAGVVLLEVAESVAGGEIRRRIIASMEGEPAPPPFLTCRNGIAVEATLRGEDGGGLLLAPMQAVPRSVPILVDRPDALHERTLLVTANYDEITMDAGGLAAAGHAVTQQRFVPLPATLVGRRRAEPDGAEPGRLVALSYRAGDGTLVDLPVEEVVARMNEAEIGPPVRLGRTDTGTFDFRTPEGRLPTVCLTATNIRRKRTIITEVLFSSSLDLSIPEAVTLQDAAAIVLRELQLIHPRNAKPYFRARPDPVPDNNFEALPAF